MHFEINQMDQSGVICVVDYFHFAIFLWLISKSDPLPFLPTYWANIHYTHMIPIDVIENSSNVHSVSIIVAVSLIWMKLVCMCVRCVNRISRVSTMHQFHHFDCEWFHLKGQFWECVEKMYINIWNGAIDDNINEMVSHIILTRK